jgi:hypothetical protein
MTREPTHRVRPQGLRRGYVRNELHKEDAKEAAKRVDDIWEKVRQRVKEMRGE